MGLVHVISFPKSGRTWLELMTARAISRLTSWDLSEILRGEVADTRWNEAAIDRPYFSHGHLNARLCRDREFQTEHYANARVFLLARDPRDVLVSHYHYMRSHHHEFSGSIESFIHHPFREEDRDSPRARFGIEPILNFMNGWALNAPILRGFELHHYEDALVDPGAMLAKLLEMCRVDADGPLIADAVEYANIENMRRLEHSRELSWHGLRGSDTVQGRKVRSAETGSHRRDLTPGQTRRVEAVIRERLHPMFARYQGAQRVGA